MVAKAIDLYQPPSQGIDAVDRHGVGPAAGRASGSWVRPRAGRQEPGPGASLGAHRPHVYWQCRSPPPLQYTPAESPETSPARLICPAAHPAARARSAHWFERSRRPAASPARGGGMSYMSARAGRRRVDRPGLLRVASQDVTILLSAHPRHRDRLGHGCDGRS